VTYHIGERISECLKSVVDQVGEVLIVDNGSDEVTLRALRAMETYSRVRVVYNSRNMGIAAALNQGVRYAIKQGYRWVLTLDHDSEATLGMVDKLLEAYRTLGDDLGIVAANPFDRNAQKFQRPDGNRRTGYIMAKGPVISSGSLIDVAVFEKVGFFNERLFIYYVDNEFCLRLLRKGLKIVVCCEAILLHSEGLKVRKRFLWRWIYYDRHGKEAKYYIARNGFYMTLNYPRDMNFGYVHLRRTGADLLKTLLYDQERAVKARYILKGFWDGVWGRYGSLNPQEGAVRQAQ